MQSPVGCRHLPNAANGPATPHKNKLQIMGPAEGELDGLGRCCVGDGLVAGISVTLHDASIAFEQLQRMHRTSTWSVAVGDGGRVGSAPRPIVSGDGPEIALLHAATAGIEHPDPSQAKNFSRSARFERKT